MFRGEENGESFSEDKLRYRGSENGGSASSGREGRSLSHLPWSSRLIYRRSTQEDVVVHVEGQKVLGKHFRHMKLMRWKSVPVIHCLLNGEY